MKRLNQSGSHLVALLVLVLALGVVGFAGYKVNQARNDSGTLTAAKVTDTTPATLTTTADLDKTSQSLDDSAAQLDNNLDDSSLDTDLNAML